MISGYRNAVKTEWRNRVWSDIARNVKDKDGYILTLAGRSFLDLKEAKRHGIDERRVIGVDIDESAVSHNVKHKRTVIKANLSDVIGNFNRPIAAVNADFCCGITNKEAQATVLSFFMSEWTKYATLTINVSVGREDTKNISAYDRTLLTGKDDKINGTNRALRLLVMCAVSAHLLSWNEKTKKMPKSNGLFLYFAGRVMNVLESHSYHKIYPRYIGRKQPMDSLIVKQFLTGEYSAHREVSESGLLRDADVCRHIAAKMAHHTMRYA